MARARKARRIPEWRSVVAITLVVLGDGLHAASFLETFEYQLFDLRLKWFGAHTAPAEHPPSWPIDEESITKVAAAVGRVPGSPPWWIRLAAKGPR